MNKQKIDLRVLYAEDEVEMRESTAELLNRRFEYLEVAVDGADAYERLTHSAFDLLITDIRMPRMDGLELIYKIKEIGIKTRCLIISAHNDTEFLMKAIEFGVEGYILKPIVRQRLVNEIERLANVIITEKNLAQRNAELLEAHLLLTQVINSSDNVAMFVVDNDYRILAFNSHFSIMMHKYRNKQVSIGTNLFDIFSTSPLDAAIPYGIKQAMNDNALKMDYEIFDDTQVKTIYKVEFKSIKHPTNNDRSVATFFTDISTLKQNENNIESEFALLKNQQSVVKEELAKVQENYTQLFHNIYDGLLIINATGSISEANSAFCDMSGIAVNDLVGQPFFSLFIPDDQALVNPLLLIKELNNSSINVLYGKLMNKIGAPIPVEVYSSKIAIKEENSLLLIIHDTNLKNKILIERNLLFQSLNKVNDSVLITNAEGIILFSNSTYKETRLANDAKIIGKHFGDESLKICDARQCEEISTNCKARKIWTGVIRGKQGGGIVQSDSLTVTPMFDTNGHLEFMLFVMHNITNELVKERNIQHLNKLETLRQVLGDISHDFKNILMAISIYAELLQDDANLSENSRKYLESIRNEIIRAQELLRKVFNYHPCLQKPFPINLKTVIEENCGLLAQTLPAGIKLETSLSTDVDYPIEHTHINQLLSNLVTNAIQAIGDQGIIRIHLKEVDTIDNLLIPDLNATHWIKLSVEDNGHGIDASIADKIFDPLFTTKAKSKGNGLGLSIVLGIVINYNGFITFNPIFPKGTRFELFLPIFE